MRQNPEVRESLRRLRRIHHAPREEDADPSPLQDRSAPFCRSRRSSQICLKVEDFALAARRRTSPARMPPSISQYQTVLHFEKAFGHSCHFCFIFVLENLVHKRRNNLLGKTELIFQQSALLCLRVCRELQPEMIYFLLDITVHHERNRLVETEVMGRECHLPLQSSLLQA